MHQGWKRWALPCGSAAIVVLGLVSPAWAQEAATAVSAPGVAPGVIPGPGAAAEVTAAQAAAAALFTANNVWMMVCASLVFIMNLGFAAVEAGLQRSKNTVNILFKNTITPCIGLLAFSLLGFGLMYPGFQAAGGYEWFGFAWFHWLSVSAAEAERLLTPAYRAGYTYWTDFFFQAMFAATCATIVSGAVGERIKLSSYVIFTALFIAVCYPVLGSWEWGYGWLDDLDFHDFAGSTVVHSVGGWGALMGAMILGPRLGKYAADGTVQPIPGHNLPLATIGVFLLWFGWFGFNGGSVLSADPAAVSLVLVTTALAGAAGGLATCFTSWIAGGKPDLSMSLNGILAGLVGITAGANVMAPWEAVVIGLIAGVLVYVAVLMFDRIRIDDPVGATSVHLVCGIWGTLAVGIFGDLGLLHGNGVRQFFVQLLGVVTYGVGAGAFAGLVFLALKATIGLRVSRAEEIEGLDLGEHDMSAYPDFQHTYIKSYHAREM